MGRKMGCCDIDGESTSCEGDVTFCEKPDALRQYFRIRLEDFRKKEEKKEDKVEKEEKDKEGKED